MVASRKSLYRHLIRLLCLGALAATLGWTATAQAAPRTIDCKTDGAKFLINTRLKAVRKSLRYKPTRYQRSWWPTFHRMKPSNAKSLTSWAQATKGANHAYGIWGLQDDAKEFKVTLRARQGDFGLQVCTFEWTDGGRTRTVPRLRGLRLVKERSITVRDGRTAGIRVGMPSDRKQYMSLVFVSPSAYMTTSKYHLSTKHIASR